MNLETFYATAQNLGTVEITDEFLATWLDAANEEREMQIGDEVYFSGFEYIGSNAKSWIKIQGTILAITEKAIQVLDCRPEGNFKVWVPKSAIYNLEWCEDMPGWDGDLRRWFMNKIKIHQYQEKMA